MTLLSDIARERVRFALATLWALSFVYLLLRTLYFRHAPLNIWWNAEEIAIYLTAGLSAPTSILPIWIYSKTGAGFEWWPYPENDARTILAMWSYMVVMGYIQWFVFIPWLVHRGFDVYDRIVDVVRRKK